MDNGTIKRIYICFTLALITLAGLLIANAHRNSSKNEEVKPTYGTTSTRQTQNNGPKPVIRTPVNSTPPVERRVISPSYSDRYGNSDCSSDCSGHDAGYDWGEENDICDTDYDNGNSEPFNEGVQQYAEDNC